MEIELDATVAISLVSSNVNSNGVLSGLVDDCRELLLRLPQVKLSHCFREANFCADVLAKLGSASSDLSLVFVSPPPVILQPLYVKIDLKKCLTASVSNIISFLIKEMVSV